MVAASYWLIASTSLIISKLSSSFTSPLHFSSNQRQLSSIATVSPLLVTASSSTTEYDIVKVELTDGRDYPIYIGSTFSDDESSSLLQSHIHGNRVLLITNDRIAPMYLERYQRLLSDGGQGIRVDIVILPDGEEHKTIDCMSKILDRALELGLDRKCTFVALGGGVIGDMVGFASAIYLRGVNFIQVCERNTECLLRDCAKM